MNTLKTKVNCHFVVLLLPVVKSTCLSKWINFRYGWLTESILLWSGFQEKSTFQTLVLDDSDLLFRICFIFYSTINFLLDRQNWMATLFTKTTPEITFKWRETPWWTLLAPFTFNFLNLITIKSECEYQWIDTLKWLTISRSKGVPGTPPPSGSNFFYFHSIFVKKIDQIIGWCSYLGGWRPFSRLRNPGCATVRTAGIFTANVAKDE